MDTTSIARAISARDAIDRVARIRFEREAVDLYAAAQTAHDTDLIQALRDAAARNGWSLNIVVADRFTAESTTARPLLIDILKLAVASPPAITIAQNYMDERLLMQAVLEERAKRMADTMKDIRTKALALRQQIAVLTDTAVARADQMRPHLNPDDSAQLTRTAQAWQFNVLPRLDSGRIWSDVLNGLDEDGLIAVERFAPSWIAANSAPLEASEPTMLVLQGVAAHMTDVANDPDVKSALINARDCIAYITDADRLVSGLSALDQRRPDVVNIGITTKQVAARIGALAELN
jgi:hypothetical protein